MTPYEPGGRDVLVAILHGVEQLKSANIPPTFEGLYVVRISKQSYDELLLDTAPRLQQAVEVPPFVPRSVKALLEPGERFAGLLQGVVAIVVTP